jgi:hypothetical protein
MKESTLSKITASVAVAKGMAQRALATSPNPQWTEYEMRSIDEWIARQGVKLVPRHSDYDSLEVTG